MDDIRKKMEDMRKRTEIAELQARAEMAAAAKDRRDRFAMAALTGLLANDKQDITMLDVVEISREYADLLIAELDKEK